METNVITKQENTNINTNDVKELVKIYNQFATDLCLYITEKTYYDNGNYIPKYRLTSPIKDIDTIYLQDSGIRNIKRFKRYLKCAIKTKSLLSVNKLLNLVYKRILKTNESVPKMVCDKDDKIQKLRSDWKKQQLIADRMLLEYKREKGDFYK